MKYLPRDPAVFSGHAQIDVLFRDTAVPVTGRGRLLLAGAVLSLLAAWYFALIIAPPALGASAPTVQQGLLPEWIGCREILHGRNPYRPTVTRQIELAIYGEPVSAAGPINQHRFAYPVFFVFLFLPAALLPFDAAQWLMLAACVLCSAKSIGWWAARARLNKTDAITFAILALAVYPAVVGLQLRQPTLMVVPLLAFSFSCVRSGRLVLAGITAALAASKPQLAIAVLLPLSIWAIASWRTRKPFLRTLAGSLLVLVLASELAVPGWITPWMDTLRAYSHYAGAKPLLADMTHGHFFLPAALLLLAAVFWVSVEFCSSDLLFAVSFSVAAFQLLFPFQIYNEVLLLPAALWAATNADRIRERGQLAVLLFGCSWIALASGWVAAVALTLWNIAAPGSGVRLWQLPLVAAWLYPMLLFAAFATFAASSLLMRQRTRITRPSVACPA
jgi:hypothetical protein